MVGVPLSDALKVGSIYGKKIIMTEFLAYIELGENAEQGQLQVGLQRSFIKHVQNCYKTQQRIDARHTNSEQ